MTLLIAFAFLAGVVTILSPCILPILPIILSSTIGPLDSIQAKKVSYARPLGIITGFITSFTFFTLFLSTIVGLSGISADFLRLLSVIIIGIFGISFLIPKFQQLLEKLFSKLAGFVPQSTSKTGFWPGVVIGLSIGLLWTPCVGPILASVISLAITGTVTLNSFLITFAYSFGTAIPMLAIMIGGQNLLRKIPWLVRNTSKIQKIFGILMIITAVAIFLNFDRKFQTFILNTFPSYGTGLTKIEDNDTVRDQLQSLGGKNIDQMDMGKPTYDMLPKGERAPELIPGGVWFNPPSPSASEGQALKYLKGKVVIVDFWTYSCINCQRTLPYLKTWYDKYKDKGLVIVGVHSPEFEFEKNPENVKKAIADFGLSYPIMQDNNFATWQAYDNQYWPAKYFIDKDGYIRYKHFGEGAYDESEKIIQELLKEAGASGIKSDINNPSYEVYSQTPETYLGYLRLDRLASPENVINNAISSYTAPTVPQNYFAMSGKWEVMQEYASPKVGAKLFLNFAAKDVYLVMRNKGIPAKVKVYLDDKLQYFGEDNKLGTVTVDADRLYKLINLPTPGRHTLRLEFLDNNAELYAFTFG